MATATQQMLHRLAAGLIGGIAAVALALPAQAVPFVHASSFWVLRLIDGSALPDTELIPAPPGVTISCAGTAEGGGTGCDDRLGGLALNETVTRTGFMVIDNPERVPLAFRLDYGPLFNGGGGGNDLSAVLGIDDPRQSAFIISSITSEALSFSSSSFSCAAPDPSVLGVKLTCGEGASDENRTFFFGPDSGTVDMTLSITTGFRDAAATPEPATLALLVPALAGLGLLRRRQPS